MAEELARIRASVGRRYLGVGMMMFLGGLLLYVALSNPPGGLGWLVFLLICGFGSLWMGHATWRATEAELILTEEALTDSNGEVLARFDQIVRVDKGMLAVKPSNGFMLILNEPGPRAWRPGLWWRMGRRVAVGGVTAARETKPVADLLAFKLAEREYKEP